MRKKLLCAVISAAMLASCLTVPAAAAGTVGSVRSDTTGNVTKSVGDQYSFLVTSKNKNAKIAYTVGNGKVLQTYTVGKPVKNADGTATYHYGFRCLNEGDTGVYMKVDGKTVNLFSVRVRYTTTFAKAIGTDAAKYSKVEIRRGMTDRTKTITDRKQIQSLLNRLASKALVRDLAGTSTKYGFNYCMDLYPVTGGSYEFIDSNGLRKNGGCKFNGPTGRWLPEHPKGSQEVDGILADFFNQK